MLQKINDSPLPILPRVEYSLSSLGRTLKPVLDALSQWGTDYKSTL